MRRAFIAVALIALPLVAHAQEERIVSGLSQNRVSITADFDGSEILVYGAVRREAPPPEGRAEIIVTAEGPAGPVSVWRKGRVAGIWINETAVGFQNAPSFYAVATTAPLAQILTPEENRKHSITIDRMIRLEAEVSAEAQAAAAMESTGQPATPRSTPFAMTLQEEEFLQALVRIRSEEGNYRLLEGRVQMLEQTLFRADVTLPANLTEGIYRVRMFLLRDGHVIDMQERWIRVRKEGLERWIYNLAKEQPLIHGLLALAMAALAGWAASAAFRLFRS